MGEIEVPKEPGSVSPVCCGSLPAQLMAGFLLLSPEPPTLSWIFAGALGHREEARPCRREAGAQGADLSFFREEGAETGRDPAPQDPL